MSSYGGTSFKVKVEDNRFPHPVLDQSDGIVHYAADVFVASRSLLVALIDKVAIVTPKRRLGTKSIYFHLESGSSASLTIPVHGGQAKSFTAVLIKCEPKGDARYTVGGYWCACEWLISSDITP